MTDPRDSMTVQQIARNIVDEFPSIVPERRGVLIQEIAGALGHERDRPTPDAGLTAERGCDIDGNETLRDWALMLADERVDAIIEPHELTHARHRREELRAILARLAAPTTAGLDPLVEDTEPHRLILEWVAARDDIQKSTSREAQARYVSAVQALSTYARLSVLPTSDSVNEDPK